METIDMEGLLTAFYWTLVALVAGFSVISWMELAGWERDKLPEKVKRFTGFFRKMGLDEPYIEHYRKHYLHVSLAWIILCVAVLVLDCALCLDTVIRGTYPALIVLFASAMPIARRFDQHIADYTGILLIEDCRQIQQESDNGSPVQNSVGSSIRTEDDPATCEQIKGSASSSAKTGE